MITFGDIQLIFNTEVPKVMKLKENIIPLGNDEKKKKTEGKMSLMVG